MRVRCLELQNIPSFLRDCRISVRRVCLARRDGGGGSHMFKDGMADCSM